MMTPTGIVRRIDDLGRIVIPKEIRKTFGIQDGDPMEIFIDKPEKTISFRKYSPTIISGLEGAISSIDPDDFPADNRTSVKRLKADFEGLLRQLKRLG